MRINIHPTGEAIEVNEGQTILEAVQRAKLSIDDVCGGKGTCGKCKVQLLGRIAGPTAIDLVHLTEVEVREGFRLACQAMVTQDVVLRIPPQDHAPWKVLHKGTGRKVILSPNVAKTVLPSAALASPPASLVEWLVGQWPGVHSSGLDLSLLQDLCLQKELDGETVTAVTAGDEIIAMERGDNQLHTYGMAFDIGTTTVVGYLLDLNIGKELAVVSASNPQRIHGADVMSRLSLVQEDSHGLQKLHEEIIGGVNALIRQAAAEAKVDSRHIYEVTAVGNAVMHHLFLKIDPSSLGQAPYVPMVKHSLSVKARDIGLSIAPGGRVHILPNIDGFIGADTTGVLLTTLLHQSAYPKLVIDLGTNGEIVLGSRERLVACSTAAGPALEGARIVHGMRAAAGAIDRVRTGDGLLWRVIGNTAPIGICGSGLIDAIAQMLDAGVIHPSGRLLKGSDLPSGVPPKIRESIAGDPGGYDPRFVLVDARESGTGAEIAITQQDVREVQLAKAAIRAGIQVLMMELGMEERDIAEVLLAGAFGSRVSPRSARRIGLIPPLPLARVKAIGNAAGFGAKLSLLSVAERKLSDHIAGRVEQVGLADHPAFQDLFFRYLPFPESRL
ncbi:MAG: DUF4445 domain-containing protein [Chloroflexi bacterium]|nr:DUF4445 domain-containing protein [Chloroflexota bacterium]